MSKFKVGQKVVCNDSSNTNVLGVVSSIAISGEITYYLIESENLLYGCIWKHPNQLSLATALERALYE